MLTEDIAGFGKIRRLQYRVYDPAIDARHQVVAFRGGNERFRQNQFLILVLHAQQDFVARFFIQPGQGH